MWHTQAYIMNIYLLLGVSTRSVLSEAIERTLSVELWSTLCYLINYFDTEKHLPNCSRASLTYFVSLYEILWFEVLWIGAYLRPRFLIGSAPGHHENDPWEDAEGL